MVKKFSVVAPPLSISHALLHSMHERINNNKSLTSKEYELLVIVVMYVLLKTKIDYSQKCESPYLTSDALLTRAMLEKALYFMDVAADCDESNDVKLVLPTVYKQQILTLLVYLLRDKVLALKPAYENSSFYEATYSSICDKLKVTKDCSFLWYLQNVHRKSKSVYVRGLSVINYEQSLEVQIYSKYDNFDKDECSNYRFIVTKSKINNYPVGCHVFGVIQDNKLDVILYKDRECTLRL